MANTVKITGNLPWAIYRRTVGSRWIGTCDPLNLAMEADSLDELHSVIAEAIVLLMRDLVTDNEIEQYMRERGWQISGLPQTPEPQELEFEL